MKICYKCWSLPLDIQADSDTSTVSVNPHTGAKKKTKTGSADLKLSYCSVLCHKMKLKCMVLVVFGRGLRVYFCNT